MIEPSDVKIFTYKGTEHIWHSDKRDFKWRFVAGQKDPEALLDGWFTVQELRDLADYMDKQS